MDKRIEIKSFNLVLGKKEISLTVDESKRLYEALQKIFKTETIVREEHHHHEDYWPYWWGYNKPVVTYMTSTGNPCELKMDYMSNTAQLSC